MKPIFKKVCKDFEGELIEYDGERVTMCIY